jgi:hypothetical protein
MGDGGGTRRAARTRIRRPAARRTRARREARRPARCPGAGAPARRRRPRAVGGRPTGAAWTGTESGRGERRVRRAAPGEDGVPALPDQGDDEGDREATGHDSRVPVLGSGHICRWWCSPSRRRELRECLPRRVLCSGTPRGPAFRRSLVGNGSQLTLAHLGIGWAGAADSSSGGRPALEETDSQPAGSCESRTPSHWPQSPVALAS